MATPTAAKKRPAVKSNTKPPTTDKKPCDCGPAPTAAQVKRGAAIARAVKLLLPAKATASVKKALADTLALMMESLDCFPLCGETGVTGLIWKDAAQTPRCLPFTFTGATEKNVGWNVNGPHWVNV